MHTGQPNPHSMTDEYFSGKIVLDTSNNKFAFTALNVSNNFATIDYDAHINTKIDYTINHVFRSMTVQELNTLHAICELERNQLVTILAMSVQNPQLAGFLLTGNRSNFLYVEGSTAWLYDFPHFLSPLYKAGRCFDSTTLILFPVNGILHENGSVLDHCGQPAIIRSLKLIWRKEQPLVLVTMASEQCEDVLITMPSTKVVFQEENFMSNTTHEILIGKRMGHCVGQTVGQEGWRL